MKAVYREDILDKEFFKDYLGVVDTVKEITIKDDDEEKFYLFTTFYNLRTDQHDPIIIIKQTDYLYMYIYDILDSKSIMEVWANLLETFGENANSDDVVIWFWINYGDEVTGLGLN